MHEIDRDKCPTARQQLADARGPHIADNHSAEYSLQIANAIARPAEIDPAPASSSTLATTATREEELTQLIEIADWWPTVKRITEASSAGVTAQLA